MMDIMVSDLAAIFQITQETVRRYINHYKKFRTIRSKSCNAGAQSILNTAESIAIDKHLTDNTYTKIKDIQHYIQITYNKNLCMTKHNFRYKKPKIIPKYASFEEQKKYIDFYNSIKNIVNHSKNTEVCLCADAVHPTQYIRQSYGWFKMEHKNNEIQSSNGRKRLNCIGYLNLTTMDVHHSYYKDTTNAKTFTESLEMTKHRIKIKLLCISSLIILGSQTQRILL